MVSKHVGCRIRVMKKKINVGLAIIARDSTDRPMMGGYKLGAEMPEELKEIRKMQQKIINFME